MKSSKISSSNDLLRSHTLESLPKKSVILDKDKLLESPENRAFLKAYCDSFLSPRESNGFRSPQHKTQSLFFTEESRIEKQGNTQFTMNDLRTLEDEQLTIKKTPRSLTLESRLDELLQENVKLNQNLNDLLCQKLQQSVCDIDGDIYSPSASPNPKDKEYYEKIIDNLNTKVSELTRDNEILTKEVIKRGGFNYISKDTHKNIVAEKDKKIDQLEKTLVEKQITIIDLQKRIDELLKQKFMKALYDKELADKQAEIAMLRKKEEAMLHRLNTSLTDLDNLAGENENLKNQFRKSISYQNIDRPGGNDLYAHIPAHKIFGVIGLLQKAVSKFKQLLIHAHRKKICQANEIKEEDQVQIARENFKGKFDVVFCIDCTSSMGKYIIEAKNACSYIMQEMKQQIERIMKADLKFGFVGYRDYGGLNGWITKVQDLTEPEQCAKFISTITALSGPGNDIPEAVIPGLLDCINKIKWRDNVDEKVLRIIFHIGDAPPHGKIYFKGRDSFPEGDPCKIKISHIAKVFFNKDISYRLVKIGKHLDLMEEEFKKHIKDFNCVTLDRAENLENMLSDLLKSEIDRMSRAKSIKDKLFLGRALDNKDLFRSQRAGNCYILSVIFDDYFDLFFNKKLSTLPILTSLTINSLDGDLLGIKCVYKLENTIIEGTLRSSSLEPNQVTTLELEDDEIFEEISGDLDDYGGISLVSFRTSKGKEITVGSPGKTQFDNILLKPSKLHSIGGSYGRNGFDSLYVYYS